jgi:transposase
MSVPLVPDDLWEAIEPVLPEERPKLNGGRPRVPDRAALAGIVFVLRTGCPWRLLPEELGCGSGTTCWRRLRDWQEAGVWARLHETILNWLGDEAAIDRSRAGLDSLSVRAKRGASRRGRTPSTAATRGRSTTSSSIAMASRWRSASRRPTRTTPPSCPRSTTPSRPSSGPVGDLDVLASAPPSSTPTKRMTQPTCAMLCDLAVSCLGLPVGGLTRASGSGGIAGWSSARSRGCSAAVASVCATSGGPTCSKGCFIWPAP